MWKAIMKLFRFQSWDVDKANDSSNSCGKRNGNSLFKKHYIVAILCFLSTLVVNSHRFNLSLAMVDMMNSTAESNDFNSTTECPAAHQSSTNAKATTGKFSWSPRLQGYILGAGFLGYVLFQIPGGILTRIFTSKVLMIWSLSVASICNLLSPVAANWNPYMLLVLTLIRGLAQGLQQPAMSVLMAKWFPENERGFLCAFVIGGYYAGTFIAGFVSGTLCELEFLDGWPLAFYTFGLLGLAAACLFLFFCEETPKAKVSPSNTADQGQLQNSTSKERPATPWLAILTSVPTYAVICGLFGMHWPVYHFVTVHPAYLGNVLNIPIRENGIQSSGPFVLQTITHWWVCYILFLLSRHTALKINTVRKICNSLGCVIVCLAILGIYFAKCNLLWNKVLLYVAISGLSPLSAGAFIAAIDMSPTFSGPLMGFANTVGSLGSFIEPVVVGYFTDEGQNLTQWGKVFLLTTAVTLLCGIIFLILGTAEVQPYDPLSRQANEKRVQEKKDQSITPETVTFSH